MVKVSKEFWVSNKFINEDQSMDSFNINRTSTDYYKNKVTVTYEIDREITINESDLENAFKDINIAGHSMIELGVMDKVKKKLFGGGENEWIKI